MQKTTNFNNVVIFSVKERDYKIIFWYMSKDDAINVMKNSDLNKISRLLQIFFLIIKDG